MTQPHQSEDATMKPVACDYEPEPEWDRGPLPEVSESEWAEFDRLRNVGKGPTLARRDADIALDLQVQYQGAIGELPR